MRAVVGVSLGASAVRAAIMDPMGRALLGTESVTVPRGRDRLEAAVEVVDSVCARHAGNRESAVLVVPDDPRCRVGSAATVLHEGGCVRVASELGAQLTYLTLRGLVEPQSTIAVVDIGKSGTSVSVVDVGSGIVHDADWSDAFRGATVAAAVREHLLAAYGTSAPRTASADATLDDGVEWALEMLAVHRAVQVGGPFLGGSVTVFRTTVDRLVLDAVTAVSSWVYDVVARGRRRVDTVVLVGGPANLPLVRGVFAQQWGEALVMPAEPQSLAARGAAVLAARTVRTRQQFASAS